MRIIPAMTAAAVAIITTTATATATAANASTVGVVDVDAAYGRRLAVDPYLDQTLARLSRTGGIRVIAVPVPDDGTLSTAEIDLVGPTPAPAVAPGIRRLTGRETLRTTMQMVDGRLGYDLTIERVSAFVDGYTRPTDGQRTVGHVYGQVDVDTSSHGPAFAQEYDAPGGRRMMIGVLRP